MVTGIKYKLIIYLDENVRVYREGHTVEEAVDNMSMRLRELCRKVRCQKWENHRVTYEDDITHFVKQLVIHA